MKKVYHKLVRDKIPRIIEEAGHDCAVRQVYGDELSGYAKKKLQEEVQEFVENPSSEEAADIMEVLSFICDRMGISHHAIRAQKLAKNARNGTFDQGLVLEWVEEK